MTTPLEIFPGIAKIAEGYPGILLDAYGVFWGGNACGLLPGAQEVMRSLVSQGKVVGILSNTTQLADKEIIKYALHGLIQGEHFHFLITSGGVTRETLLHEKLPFETPRNQYLLVGDNHPKFASHETIFQGSVYKQVAQIDQADFLYISIPHLNGEDQTDPEVFRGQVKKLREKNLPMLCSNPDHFAHEGKPAKAVVRQGSIARLYEELGGQVFYIGKPRELVYECAMNQFKVHQIIHPKAILMVGDTPETDIRGARRFGMRSALITQTGMMAARISQHGLENALQKLSSHDSPDYYIGALKDDL